METTTRPIHRATIRAVFAGALLAAAFVATAQKAEAYPTYDDGFGNGCVSCHPLFQGGNSGSLHATHLNNFGVTTCNLCHPNGGGTLPVRTFTSGPGGGFGCAGCHGHDYGENSVTAPAAGQPKATAYGLRQVHASAGVTVCAGCHVPGALGHSMPFPPLFGENVNPPYYGTAGTSLRNACDTNQEDSGFFLDSSPTRGLDNDGDGLRDYPDDPDCPTTTTTTTTTSTTTTTLPVACGPAPLGSCTAATSASLKVSEKTAGKESVKLSLKNLQAALSQADFGDPVAGNTSYAVCIYDQSNVLVGELGVARAGEVCAGKLCWSAVSTKGYKYGDKDADADGVTKISLSGGDGNGKASVGAKNNAAKGQTALPTGIAAALSGDTSATVQILSSDAECFGASLTEVKTADGVSFSAGTP